MNTRTLRTPVAFAMLAAGLAIAGCGSHSMKPAATMDPKIDGQVRVPDAYRGWPRFVPTVDKPESGQVREIYINPVGAAVRKGEAFAPGTVTVMEIWAARKDGAGQLARDAAGRLQKGELAKIFVMAKGAGWGAAQPAGVIGNGDWLYGAWEADGTTAAEVDYGSCRGCHAPLAGSDFVARYDEHFTMR